MDHQAIPTYRVYRLYDSGRYILYMQRRIVNHLLEYRRIQETKFAAL